MLNLNLEPRHSGKISDYIKNILGFSHGNISYEDISYGDISYGDIWTCIQLLPKGHDDQKEKLKIDPPYCARELIETNRLCSLRELIEI